VWEWSGVAADEGDEAAAWFSKFLERPVRLVRCDQGAVTLRCLKLLHLMTLQNAFADGENGAQTAACQS
jgi:uncharacterized protein YcbX